MVVVVLIDNFLMVDSDDDEDVCDDEDEGDVSDDFLRLVKMV